MILSRNAIRCAERHFFRFENQFYCNTLVGNSSLYRNFPPDDRSTCETNNGETFGKLTKALEVSVGRKTRGLVSKFGANASEICRHEKERDIFGTLSEGEAKYKELLSTEFSGEEKDGDESTQVLAEGQKPKRIVDYAFDMRNLARSGKLKEALDLLDWLNGHVRIRHESAYLFTLAIGLCGRAGYTQKAFRLFRQLKDRGLKVTPAVLTGLFNSCAQCPFPEYGLEQARFLYQSILAKGWPMNEIVYHAAIKAFGRCGDMEKAFELVDEMIAERRAVTAETFSFLLMACVSDTDAGFSHAVSVVRKMMRMRIRPSTFVYDLLLRATRDCGLGPPEIAAKLLLEWKPQRKNPGLKFAGFLESRAQEMLPFVAGDEAKSAVQRSCSEEVQCLEVGSRDTLEIQLSPELVHVDLLLPKPERSEIVALSESRYSSDKLNLLGGPRGILLKFRAANLRPSVKTFTILLGCIPPKREAESHLLFLMDEWHVTPDVDFFNVLIKRRGVRHDFAGARDVLDLIRKRHLRPDVATFGALAMTCRGRNKSASFLAEVASCGVRPNVEMFGALVCGAKENLDFGNLLFLLKRMKEDSICPDDRMLQELEQIKASARSVVLDMDQGKSRYNPSHFRDDFKKFSLYYDQWLKAVRVELPNHPWKQYGLDV